MKRERKPPADFLGACVQFEVRRNDVAANLAAVERHLRTARAAGVRLAVLPELWSTSFAPSYPAAVLDAAREAEASLANLSHALDMVVVGSAVEAAGGALYNRAQVFDAGRLAASYRKIHLFSPNAEQRTISAGHEPAVADTRIGRLAVAICYDLRFPELLRWYFYSQAEMLVVPAQWPETRASHWRALLDARAIENQMFVLGCNRTGSEPSLKTADQLVFPGNSRVVDPMGEVLASGTGEEGAVVATIDLRKVQTMRRMMPIGKDRRPAIYRRVWQVAWNVPLNPQTP